MGEEVYLNLFEVMQTSSFWKIIFIVTLPTTFSIALYILMCYLIKKER